MEQEAKGLSTEQEALKAQEGAIGLGDAPSGGAQPEGATVNYEQKYLGQQHQLEVVSRERDALRGQSDLGAKVQALTELVQVLVLSGGVDASAADEPEGEVRKAPTPAAQALADFKAKQAQAENVQGAVTFARNELRERLEDAGLTPEDLPAFAGITATLEAEIGVNPAAAYEKAKKALSSELRKQRGESSGPSRGAAEPEIRTPSGPGGVGRSWAQAQKITKLTDLSDTDYERLIAAG